MTAVERWTSILKQSGLEFRSGLGQNFLVDGQILERIASELPEREDVVEIGSGPGNLTALLAARAGRVWAFEVDGRWMEFARDRVRASNIEWFLEDGEGFARRIKGRPWAVANLPYAHYYRLTLSLFEADLARICLTLQSDVFDRFVAPPGSPDYGPISVLAQAHYAVEKRFAIPRRSFYPQPRVDSIFFSMTPRRRAEGARALDAKLTAAFSRRRKRAPGSDRRIEQLGPAELLQRLDELVDRP
jgi:16S rRNA (adenine1518-N6/adenine1519-N6)-dimethyltransferase